MAEEDKHARKTHGKAAASTREERLAQALRSNLLKRKENARAKRSGSEGTGGEQQG